MDALLRATSDVYKLPEAQPVHLQTVFKFFRDDGMVLGEDKNYILQWDDLICLDDNSEFSWVNIVIEALLHACGKKVRSYFRTKKQTDKLEGCRLGIDLFEKRRYEPAVNFLFTAILVFLMTGPLLILYAVRNLNGYVQIVMAMACTMFVALLCATATRAKKHEIFGITAAGIIPSASTLNAKISHI
ncbi:hypothetical protein B0A52_04077 [Exophiala mesophila]|uniref:DUF6594 domain-containing protein n=1 Tax=Exophiala mesophila TaxID=212818 RepID=A0A438NAA0_EXOME|nr:hypothetical protein B0A52_04077 [Exophiala mesophila]